ncbi:MAG: hypothetical protein JO023_26905 [Chloroflexi bacterium]|nr:hypothetical protein [Chloroflexota bacterium]
MRTRSLLALLCVCAVLSGAVGCAPDVRRQRAAEFADQLDQARQTLLADPSQGDAVCGTAESVSTGLEGVSGLSDLRPTYQQLVDATDTLTAACGQLRLVGLPADASRATVAAAHERWRAGAAHDLELTCQNLSAADRSLNRVPPDCPA